METKLPVEATIEAMIFRSNKKPKYFPIILWKLIRKVEIRFKRSKGITGKWEDKGEISFAKTVIK